jgi:thioredoxin-related protein
VTPGVAVTTRRRQHSLVHSGKDLMRQLSKSLVILSLLSVGVRVGGQTPAAASNVARPADQLVGEGIRAAKGQHRLVLVDVGSSGCGWCHQFNKFLADTGPAGRTMRDNFVIVPLVIDETEPAMIARNNPGADTLIDRFYPKAHEGGIPFYAILDTTGRVIGTSYELPDGSNIGHPEADIEIESFDRLLARVAPRITQAQREKIKAYLIGMRTRKTGETH